ncbi:hypothetical protein PVA44_06755 (plasmid) [Entomospira nematocerorum]|uniref:Uncharacterized protein n=1 Tax=Entomospira nematocerorum TaxID=2719987 RepID=A0A968GG31_9SPIO|nr:hypothetical protein [Entomospira nematocera]NIZ47605.1 hypothetical protein [Entomospira nematocera]WDI34609.1 hypothetical protein PVA44_06755 [Entomospira nematocera]
MHHDDSSSAWRSQRLREYAYDLPENHQYPSVDYLIPIIQQDTRSDDQLAEALHLPLHIIRHYRQLLGSSQDRINDDVQIAPQSGLATLQQQYDAIVHLHYQNVYRAEHLKRRYLDIICHQMHDNQPLRACDLAFIKHASKVEH